MNILRYGIHGQLFYNFELLFRVYIEQQNNKIRIPELKAKFKFLCNTHQACPEVKNILKNIGFTDFKDLNNSTSFDIFAKFELENEEEKEKIAQRVFEQCQEKVQTIQIET